MGKPRFFEGFHGGLRLLVFLLVVPAFGLVLYSNLVQRHVQMEGVRQGAKSLAELAASNESDVIKNARQLLGTLTQFPFLVLNSNRPVCEAHFSNLLKLSPDYLNFGLIEHNGQLFCSGITSNLSIDLSDRSYFQGTIGRGQFSIGDFQEGRLTHEASLNFGYPVLDENGVCSRVLFASLKMSRLSEAVAHIHLPPGGTILILDRKGRVLAYEPGSQNWTGRSVAQKPVVRRIMETNEPVFSMPGLDSVPQLHAVTSISDGRARSLFLCVSIPLAVSVAEANRALVQNCAVLILVALIVLAAAWFYSQRYFLRPVDLLVKAANSLAAGNLQARTGPMRGAPELVLLGNAFNEMAENLATRQAELVKVNETLKTEVTERHLAEQRIREQTKEQRELEQQLLRSQRMESLGSLAGGIAHDLNNALVPILMGSELLRASARVAEDASIIDLITASARRCTQMVKQIVNFAKGSSSNATATKVNEVVAEMAKIAGETFPKSIVVGTNVSPDLNRIECGGAELHQVLMNLCVNSRDAMPQGGKLTIAARNITLDEESARKHSDVQPGHYVALAVTDTGVGMSPDTVKRIFEPFYTTKTADKGTGLGLSTVAQIIKRHHGFIEVQSSVGEGTTFTMLLPATMVTDTKNIGVKPTRTHLGKGELILVVDDEQMLLAMAKTTLENYGYRVITARNGLEAVACFEARKSEIRLLMSDTDMPFLNGARAIEKIRELKPEVPVIIAGGMQSAEELTTHPGDTQLTRLSKPYGVEELLSTVEQALGVSTQH